jgi:hypothetical protein
MAAKWSQVVLCCVLVCSCAADPADHHHTQSPADHHRTLRVAAFPGPFGEEASAKLAEFRSRLLSANAVLFAKKENTTEDYNEMLTRYDMYQPFVSCPAGRPLSRVGSPGDGGKQLCKLNMQPPCTIYSLGSEMKFDFEEVALNQTSCHVHTFDCTVPGKVLDPVRHNYHKLCIGRTELSTAQRRYESFR